MLRLGVVALVAALSIWLSPTLQAQEDRVAAILRDAVAQPEAALEALVALRDEPAPEGHRARIGMQRVLMLQKRFDEALALSDELLADATLAPAQKIAAVSARLALMQATRQWNDEERIIAMVGDDLIAAADAETAARYYQELGALRTTQMRLPEAESAFLSGIDIVGEPLRERHVLLHRTLGVVYAQQGRFADAIEQMRKAEQYMAELGMPDDFALLRNFGGLYLYMEEHAKAIEYLARAEQVFKANPTPDPPTLISLFSTHAGALAAAGRYADAHAKFDEGLSYARANGIESPGLLNNQGFLFRKEGRHREALANFERALEVSKANPDPSTSGVFEKNIGESLLALGEKARAAEFLLLAEQLQREHSPVVKRLELLPLLIQVLDETDRPREALEFMREYKRLNDEVVNSESKERIAKLESVVALERQARELASSEQQRAVQTAENDVLRAQQQRQRLIIGGILVSMLALSIILGLLVRDRRFKAMAHRELESRNARIEAQRIDLEKLNDALRRQSREDALTGLNNRYFLTDFMAAAHTLGTAQERPVQSMLLIMADLDHFKRINDEHGHLSGDKVLVAFASVLRGVQSERDVLVRWGGEEFIWLCLGAGAADGQAQCERLRAALNDVDIRGDNGQRIRVTASLGFVAIPIWPGIECPWEVVLRLADNAIYKSKAEGRDRWTGYRGLKPPLRIAADTQTDALENGGHVECVRMPDGKG